VEADSAELACVGPLQGVSVVIWVGSVSEEQPFSGEYFDDSEVVLEPQSFAEQPGSGLQEYFELQNR
jgi:hypothetical protein